MIELVTYRDIPINSADIILQSELLECLLNIELRFGESHLGGKSRVAVFDLDNTLLIGDIGDAVYTQLLSDGFPLPLSWLDYQQMIKEDPKRAYMEAVIALDGIPLEYLVRTTKRILQSEDDMILCEGSEVLIPKPNHLMYELVRLLHQWQYTIFVISASNDISAKIAGSMIFDIPGE
jgi:phosphoserine phosphatase